MAFGFCFGASARASLGSLLSACIVCGLVLVKVENRLPPAATPSYHAGVLSLDSGQLENYVAQEIGIHEAFVAEQLARLSTSTPAAPLPASPTHFPTGPPTQTPTEAPSSVDALNPTQLPTQKSELAQR